MLYLSSGWHIDKSLFLRQIRRTNTTIVRVTYQDEEQAERIIFTYQDKIFSFTDATSFAVMESQESLMLLHLIETLLSMAWLYLPQVLHETSLLS